MLVLILKSQQVSSIHGNCFKTVSSIPACTSCFLHIRLLHTQQHVHHLGTVNISVAVNTYFQNATTLCVRFVHAYNCAMVWTAQCQNSMCVCVHRGRMWVWAFGCPPSGPTNIRLVKLVHIQRLIKVFLQASKLCDWMRTVLILYNQEGPIEIFTHRCTFLSHTVTFRHWH